MAFDPDKARDVSSTSRAYDAMSPDWLKIMALLGGTKTMRDAGELYLPRHSRESMFAYDQRLSTNVLLNVTELTLNDWVGKPFSQPVGFGDDVPPAIVALEDDIDLQGADIGSFLRRAFRQVCAFGMVHIRVDVPRRSGLDGRPSRLDDIRQGIRPYWALEHPLNVFFAHAEDVGGIEVLRHMRIMDTVTEMEGFTESEMKRIQVWDPFQLSTWIESERTVGGEPVWIEVGEPVAYDFPRIPIFTFYADRTDFMQSKAPLLDLADLNIDHWQLSSNLRRGVTASMFPMLARSGGSIEPDEEVEIGPFKLLHLSDPSGRYYYVEHSGSSLGTGMSYLQTVEDAMGLYGAEFLRARPGTITVQKTATQTAIEEASVVSPLESLTLRFKDFMEEVLDFTAEIMGFGNLPGTGGTIDIKTDFSGSDTDRNLEYLDAARARRDISADAYLLELIRREVLPEDFDIALDRERLASEPIYGGLTERDIELVEAERRRGSLRDNIESL